MIKDSPFYMIMNKQQRRLIIDTLCLGVVGALSAQLFTLLLRAAQYVFLILIADYWPPGVPDEGGVLRQVVGPHGLLLILSQRLWVVSSRAFSFIALLPKRKAMGPIPP